MKNKKIAVVIGMVAILFFVTNSYADTRGVTDNEIRIGSHMDLSGPVAAWSISAANSIRMRFDEVNAKGGIHGRKLKFIAEDTQYQVPLAIQKANKLINRDKVFLLLTSLGTSQNNAVFNQIQKEKNVPNFLPMSWAKDHAEPFDRLKFIGVATYYDQTRAVTKYFVEKMNKKRFGLMYCETGYGEECAQGVIDQLKAMNMEAVEVTSHAVTETNFINQVNKMRNAGVDVIALGTIVRDGLRLVKTIKDLGWDVDLIGFPGMASKKIPELGGSATEGMYLVTGIELMYPDQATDPKAVAFFNNYQKLYNEEPSAVAQLGYTFADMCVLALEKAGRNLTVDTFIEAAESIEGYKSMFNGPDRSFGPSKHVASDEAILLQVKNGRFVSPVKDTKILLSY
jgi:branched-chain amino acid transport system substrate-binding protein